MILKRIYFSIICFCLVFNNLPKILQVSIIGGALQNKLVLYAVIVGMIYTLYYQYKYRDVFINFDKFFKFTVVYMVVFCVSLIICLYTYPYYNFVLNGPITQIEKLPKVINTLNNFGIFVDEKILTIIWMIQGIIKSVLFGSIICFWWSIYDFLLVL